MRKLGSTLVLSLAWLSACGGAPATPATSAPQVTATVAATPPAEPLPPAPAAAVQVATPPEAGQTRLTVAAAPRCVAVDWSARSLSALLQPGKKPSRARGDQSGVAQLVFDSECTDAPGGPTEASPRNVVLDGVAIDLVGAAPAGASGRGWTGNQCAFELRLADGSGKRVRLGAEQVPPFTTVNALTRSGSAVWLSLSFNGYTREFPRGGNRVIALDLCDGRVAWQSKDSTSNGGLLLLGDYLVSPYGFTSEPRFVFVLDAHSGAVVQKLPVVENVCPSRSWAPHWHAGDACDAPGQRVGAATNPRIEAGLFMVDTNTGSAAFQLK